MVTDWVSFPSVSVPGTSSSVGSSPLGPIQLTLTDGTRDRRPWGRVERHADGLGDGPPLTRTPRATANSVDAVGIQPSGPPAGGGSFTVEFDFQGGPADDRVVFLVGQLFKSSPGEETTATLTAFDGANSLAIGDVLDFSGTTYTRNSDTSNLSWDPTTGVLSNTGPNNTNSGYDFLTVKAGQTLTRLDITYKSTVTNGPFGDFVYAGVGVVAPEPSTLLMSGLGLAGVAAYRRRRASRAG